MVFYHVISSEEISKEEDMGRLPVINILVYKYAKRSKIFMIMRLLDQYYEENRANARGSFMILFSIFSVGGLVMFCNVLYEMINTLLLSSIKAFAFLDSKVHILFKRILEKDYDFHIFHKSIEIIEMSMFESSRACLFKT